MVITFNKRELIEFANWNIKQERFPEKFCFHPPQGYDFKPFIELMNKKGFSTNYLTTCYFEEDIKKGDWLACYDDDAGVKVLISHSKKDMPANLPRLYQDKFERCLNYEKIPLLTDEDLRCWLKFEKGLTIEKVYKQGDWDSYRQLKKDEVIKPGDEILYETKGWVEVNEDSVGSKAPDPSYSSHRWYRRLKKQ